MDWLEYVRKFNLVSDFITDTELIAARCPADYTPCAPDIDSKKCTNNCAECWHTQI